MKKVYANPQVLGHPYTAVNPAALPHNLYQPNTYEAYGKNVINPVQVVPQHPYIQQSPNIVYIHQRPQHGLPQYNPIQFITPEKPKQIYPQEKYIIPNQNPHYQHTPDLNQLKKNNPKLIINNQNEQIVTNNQVLQIYQNPLQLKRNFSSQNIRNKNDMNQHINRPPYLENPLYQNNNQVMQVEKDRQRPNIQYKNVPRDIAIAQIERNIPQTNNPRIINQNNVFLSPQNNIKAKPNVAFQQQNNKEEINYTNNLEDFQSKNEENKLVPNLPNNERFQGQINPRTNKNPRTNLKIDENAREKMRTKNPHDLYKTPQLDPFEVDKTSPQKQNNIQKKNLLQIPNNQLQNKKIQNRTPSPNDRNSEIQIKKNMKNQEEHVNNFRVL